MIRLGGMVIAFALALTAGAASQDPYTADDQARMKRAGYVTFAPETFRPEVTKHLPQTKILWVETRHFILGCGLGPKDAPKTSKRRRQFQRELGRLRAVLPRVKKTTRRIDRWLWLHLYAQRLERLYDEMQFLLRVTDDDFQNTTEKADHSQPEKFMGRGAYLGMRGKFRVLILSSRDDLDRLESAITGRTSGAGSFHFNDQRANALAYAVCLDLYRDQREPEYTVRCQVRFNVAQNLLKGYRHYDFALPVWLQDGLGNLLLRDMDPGQFAFSGIRGGGEPTARNAKWAANTRRLVKNGLAPKSDRICVAPDASAFSLNDHMASWSRLDYLRSLDDGRTLARFLRRMKRPIAGKRGVPTFAEVLASQENAFVEALGSKFAEFDSAWRSFVLRRYPRR